MERFPRLLSYPVDRLEAHVQYLFQRVGISEDKLGQVRYCLLFSYAFCEIFQASSAHRGVNDRQLLGMDATVRSPHDSLMRY